MAMWRRYELLVKDEIIIVGHCDALGRVRTRLHGNPLHRTRFFAKEGFVLLVDIDRLFLPRSQLSGQARTPS